MLQSGIYSDGGLTKHLLLGKRCEAVFHQAAGVVTAIALHGDGDTLQLTAETAVELAADGVLATKLHDFKKSVTEICFTKSRTAELLQSEFLLEVWELRVFLEEVLIGRVHLTDGIRKAF